MKVTKFCFHLTALCEQLLCIRRVGCLFCTRVGRWLIPSTTDKLYPCIARAQCNRSAILSFMYSCYATLLGKMIKGGRPSAGSVTGDSLQVLAPQFVRVKKRTIMTEKACKKEGGSDEKVEDRRASVVFVGKSASLMLKEARGSRVKVVSPTSRSTPGASTTPGGKRQLAATQEGEGGAVERKVAKKTKLEEDVPVRHSSKRKKRRRHGQKVVTAPAKKDHLEEALSYLKTWHTQRESWSFRKKMQVCLLEHMYNSEKVARTHAHTHTHSCSDLVWLPMFRLASHSLHPSSSTWKALRERAEQLKCRGPRR